MAAENGITIDGKLYEIPGLDTFSLGEARVLWDYCEMSLDDFVGEDDDELLRRIRHPGFLGAIAHVAYQRANPDVPRKRVEKLIESSNVLEAIEHMADAGEDDALPPESTTELDESSPRSSVDLRPSSGNRSETDSDEPVENLRAIMGGSSPLSESHPGVSAG